MINNCKHNVQFSMNVDILNMFGFCQAECIKCKYTWVGVLGRKVPLGDIQINCSHIAHFSLNLTDIQLYGICIAKCEKCNYTWSGVLGRSNFW